MAREEEEVMPSYSEIEEGGKILDALIEGNEGHYDELAEVFAKEERTRSAKTSAFFDSLFRANRPTNEGSK
jgi:hypothetical protein